MAGYNFLSDMSKASSDEEASSFIPAWMRGADAHNIGNTQGGSWFDPATWGTKFENAGKFMAVSVLSGGNSFYNTGVSVANWFGADVKEQDTRALISSFDDNWAQYYSENRQAADLVGFVAGAIIPGMAGVKVLNAGQKALRAMEAGSSGAAMRWSTGLLAPKTEKFMELAKADIVSNRATFSQLNGNALRMYASGAQQQVLEAAAFEVAAFAALHKAPIFDEMDAGDVAKNILIGAAVGGGIGTVFQSVKGYYGLKKAVTQEDVAGRIATARELTEQSLAPSEKLILTAYNREAMPVPVKLGGVETEQYTKDVGAWLKSQEKYNNEMRTQVHAMFGTAIGKVKGGTTNRAADVEMGNLLADTLHVRPEDLLEGVAPRVNAQRVMEHFAGAQQLGRVRETLDIEREIKAAVKAGTPQDPENLISYVRLHGMKEGEISFEAPQVLGLADFVQPLANQSTRDAVLQFVKQQEFTTKVPFNPLTATANVRPNAVHRIMEARKIWIEKNFVTLPADKILNVHQFDIPMIEHALLTKQFDRIKLVDESGMGGVTPLSSKELYDHLVEVKQIVAEGLQKVHTGIADEAVARATNVSLDYLQGTRNLERTKQDIFWRESLNETYTESKVSLGLVSRNTLTSNGMEAPTMLRTEFLPEWVKMGHKIPEEMRAGINGHVLDGIAYFKGLEKKAIEDSLNVVTAHLRMDAKELALWNDDALMQVSRQGAGPGLFSFAAGKYGGPEAIAQALGARANLIKGARKEAVQETLKAPLINLAQDRAAAIEFEVINRQMALTAEKYVYLGAEEATGLGFQGAGLIARKTLKSLRGMQDDVDEMDDLRQALQAGAPEFVPIKSELTRQVIETHVRENGRRVAANKDIAAVSGRTNAIDPGTYYPIKPNPNDYPHVAFVRDERVTGAGHASMIHANSERELQELIARVPPEYKTYTKAQAAEFKQAQGDYEFSRGLNENYIDTELKRAGVAGRFFPQTDPDKIVKDILNHHLSAEDALTTDLLRLANRKAYQWLEDQGNAYAELEASKYKGSIDAAKKWEKNPYLSYIRTSLDVQQVQNYPLWADLNRKLDGAVSQVVAKIRGVGPIKGEAEIEAINKELKAAGYNNAFYDASLNLWANHPAPRGELTKFVRGANAVLARITLGLDPLNALTNIIGANVLRGTELKQLTRAIQEANPEIAGRLAEITRVQLPGIADKASMLAPQKLMARSVQRFFEDMRAPGNPLATQYKAEGWIKTQVDQFRQTLDDFTLQGTESVAALQSKFRAGATRAADLGEVATGNKFAEEFNRFISADVMRQITDLAQEAGVLSAREARTYINTFVSRVEGNFLASQRPFAFQGPIGQAIGLFQSYQFNLMQQLFRYVGEGKGKDVAMLLGLQGTFFGLNGLPAFQAINEHIIGSASGNPQNKDMYDAAYGVFGKTGGEFLLYGAPSSLLQANIYSRGDINPRQLTILPNSLNQVPFIGAYGKFFSSMWEVGKNSAAGAPVWDSFLEGMEHNGLSRPMAGLAQTLRAVSTPNGEVFSTSTKGTVMGTNDLFSYATAVRLAGGRPMDEAIVNDAVYRIRAYEGLERERKQRLSEAAKISMGGGQTPSEDSVAQFAERYLELGGKQSGFNRWMMEQYKKANTAQSEVILNQLNNPLNQKLQVLMGGQE